ncbi:DUF4339 domain-containing protein [Bordetella genomosp. 1]|uniref:GYF domain-containing protein n=1 Tax=Bordetella genomosp. 1 TaxID=1395607 RepID=A0ABX4F033_9BORD|nr:DUF4339 domain-containing protein [Bordetella genomosp. 1]OZI65372.1 hypothetical protein CAL27_10055 [Bordetella genomosp. 1]
MSEWHYERNGQRISGVSETELRDLMNQNVVTGQTLVWRPGFTDWLRVQETELAPHLGAVQTPPPLPAARIGSGWVWTLALAPVLGLMLEGIISGIYSHSEYELTLVLLSRKFWYATVILNILLGIMDERSLKRAGVDTKAFGKMVFLVPVYLWMRAKHLNQSPSYFWVWIVLFFLTAFA